MIFRGIIEIDIRHIPQKHIFALVGEYDGVLDLVDVLVITGRDNVIGFRVFYDTSAGDICDFALDGLQYAVWRDLHLGHFFDVQIDLHLRIG